MWQPSFRQPKRTCRRRYSPRFLHCRTTLTLVDLGRCRADDLESLAVRFLQGSLPWDGLEADNRNEKIKMIQGKKEAFDNSQLSDEVPRELVLYFDHIRSMGLNEKPRYAYLRKIFRDLFVRRGFAYDHVYDWSICMRSPPHLRRSGCIKYRCLLNGFYVVSRCEL